VEKVGKSNTLDSTIKHKAEKCFRKHRLKDPKGKEEMTQVAVSSQINTKLMNTRCGAERTIVEC
jgi:hypothetical protein